MKTTAKAEFKQWQVLPVLSRPPVEGEATNALPECRAAESTGPSLAKPVRVECLSSSGTIGEIQGAGTPPKDVSTGRISQRP
jgi:hypothetical protein